MIPEPISKPAFRPLQKQSLLTLQNALPVKPQKASFLPQNLQKTLKFSFLFYCSFQFVAHLSMPVVVDQPAAIHFEKLGKVFHQKASLIKICAYVRQTHTQSPAIQQPAVRKIKIPRSPGMLIGDCISKNNFICKVRKARNSWVVLLVVCASKAFVLRRS